MKDTSAHKLGWRKCVRAGYRGGPDNRNFRKTERAYLLINLSRLRKYIVAICSDQGLDLAYREARCVKHTWLNEAQAGGGYTAQGDGERGPRAGAPGGPGRPRASPAVAGPAPACPLGGGRGGAGASAGRRATPAAPGFRRGQRPFSSPNKT